MSTTTVFSDLNVRLSQVDSDDKTVIVDSKAVVQSVWRLFKTEEGEIPYFRAYGLNLKQFIQKPMTTSTADEIYRYCRDKVKKFEQRAEIINCDADANRDQGYISMIFTLRVKATNELITLDELQVPVGA